MNLLDKILHALIPTDVTTWDKKSGKTVQYMQGGLTGRGGTIEQAKAAINKITSPQPIKAQKPAYKQPTPTPQRSVLAAQYSRPASPTPTLAPQVAGNPYESIIKQVFPQDQVNNAMNIMSKESGSYNYNPLTYNTNTSQGGYGVANSLEELMQIIQQYPRTDVGPYQINNYWQRENLPKAGYTIQDMTDPQKAIEYANWLHNQNGWNPWISSKSLGLYR